MHSAAYYLDKFADKEIRELKVFCQNKVKGCIWSDRLKFLEVSLFFIQQTLIAGLLLVNCWKALTRRVKLVLLGLAF